MYESHELNWFEWDTYRIVVHTLKTRGSEEAIQGWPHASHASNCPPVTGAAPLPSTFLAATVVNAGWMRSEDFC